VEEDFLAVVAAHEAEAAIAHQLLDLPADPGSAGRRRGGTPLPPTPPARAAEAVAQRELLAEQLHGHHEIL